MRRFPESLGKGGVSFTKILKHESWFTVCWRQSAYFTMNIWTYLHQILPFKPGHFHRKQAVPKGLKKDQETHHKAKYGG